MDSIIEGFIRAFSLIYGLDRELLNIIFLSIKVSGMALLIATAAGVPAGAFVGLTKFPRREFTISILNTFMGLPPVVVGLFSSGEIQRLGIARAMVIRPEIVFLDEPTASIDQKNTEIIEDIILNMKREQRSIAVITTHDAAQAKRLADRLLVMQNGKIVE